MEFVIVVSDRKTKWEKIDKTGKDSAIRLGALLDVFVAGCSWLIQCFYNKKTISPSSIFIDGHRWSTQQMLLFRGKISDPGDGGWTIVDEH